MGKVEEVLEREDGGDTTANTIGKSIDHSSINMYGFLSDSEQASQASLPSASSGSIGNRTEASHQLRQDRS